MSILKQLGVRLPIIQAPMAGVSTPQMAAAVSNAGGLGSIGIGSSDVDAAQQAIRRVRELTDKPFNVNVFVHRPAKIDAARCGAWIEHLRPTFESFGTAAPRSLREIYKTFDGHVAMLNVLLETRPPVVSFHFGLPSVYAIDKLHDAGIMLFSSVTSLEEACMAERAGMDCLVVSYVIVHTHT